MASQTLRDSKSRKGDPLIEALVALSQIDAPRLSLSGLVQGIDTILRRAHVTTGTVLVAVPAAGEPAVPGQPEILLESPAVPEGQRAQLLRLLDRQHHTAVDLVMASLRFRLYPLGTTASGRGIVLLFKPGADFRRAQEPLMTVALSLLRMKVASGAAEPAVDPLDATRVRHLYDILRSIEPSQTAEQLAASIVPYLPSFVAFDLAGLLLDEGTRTHVTLLPARPVSRALEDSFVAELVAEHRSQTGTHVGPQDVSRLAPLAAGLAAAQGQLSSRLSLPLITRRGHVVGRLTVGSTRPGGYGEEELVSFSTLVHHLSALLENRWLVMELEREARTDAMTELYNYRTFRRILTGEFSRATRHHQPLSLMMLDIDHFKQINDTYGHPAGDEVLRAVARLLQKSKRREDIVARYGGEEFVIILPETTLEGARQLAERLRVRLEKTRIIKDRRVTASIGVATQASGLDGSDEKLIAQADAMLYRAKRGGRNRVEVQG